MDENYLYECFATAGKLVSVKIIRNRQIGQSDGYGFLEFVDHAAAQMALQNYNGLQMPLAEEFYRLNWAMYKSDNEFTIFVGNLAFDDTEDLLQESFKAVYPSVKRAKVITEKNTGLSKGCGFVTFGDQNEQTRAITEMNGKFCSSRPMRIGPAMKKQTPAYPQLSVSENDPNNKTLFVGDLDPTVTTETLTETFGKFGGLVYAKIPLGKRCGYVQFMNRASAELALQKLHGSVIGQRPISVSWKRSPADAQVQRAQIQQPYLNQWNGGYHGPGHNASYGYMS